MAHPNEPSLEVLEERRAELYAAECTVEVEKKINAIEVQIARLKDEQRSES